MTTRPLPKRGPLRVIVESPLDGPTADVVRRNVDYARRCLRDSFTRGEAPFASHLLYTQPGVLDDKDPNERAQGIGAGFVWGEVADLVAVYIDHGISKGMRDGIDVALERGTTITYRSLFMDERDITCIRIY